MSCTDFHLVHAATNAREELGFAALAVDLRSTPDEARALVMQDWQQTGDDLMYAQCLDRGDAIIAARAGLPVAVVEYWIHSRFECANRMPPPPALVRVLGAWIVQ
jgi:hypothetical protein